MPNSASRRSGSSGPFQLNDRQRAAVEYTAGPLLVLAGAGSGKTRVIIEKIAWLVQRVQTPSQRIAAITFTNKAAREMKVRLERRLGADTARRVRLSTFHSLGWAMVREHCTHLGLRPGISILDESDSQTVVRDLLPEGTAPELIRMTRAGISRLKNRALKAGESQLQADSAGEVSMSRLYLQYDQHLRNLNAVDFDDLILLPLQLLRLEEVRACWQERIRYTLVDEYQDTNEAQYRMLRVLAGDNGRLTVVGDDDQSIYGWRGAQPENIDRLAIDYPALKMIKLEQNYRSCGRVLKAANALIAHNPHNHEKRLWSALGEGEPIRVLPCESETAEAATVASDILHRKYTSRAGWGDFAVLYRGNHQSRPLEKALREQKIPYHLSGGTSFFDRSEIKDLMCYLRLAVNPDDNTAFLRVVNTPRRDIGVSTRGKIAMHAGAHQQSLFDAAQSPELLASLNKRTSDSLKAFSRQIIATGDRGERSDPLEAVRDLYKWTAYDDWLRDSSDSRAKAEKRIENVGEFIAWLDRLADDTPGSGLVDLLGKLSLLTGLDQEAEAGQEVRLMTLHGAKGLEFPHVFLVGVEEDLLPHRNSITEDAEHEERRLMYVGMTRARESLTLSYAARRRSYGDMVRCKPSRFLDEIPAELIERRGDDPIADKALSRVRGRAHMEKLKELFGD